MCVARLFGTPSIKQHHSRYGQNNSSTFPNVRRIVPLSRVVMVGDV
jgi:hypothetical protein